MLEYAHPAFVGEFWKEAGKLLVQNAAHENGVIEGCYPTAASMLELASAGVSPVPAEELRPLYLRNEVARKSQPKRD